MVHLALDEQSGKESKSWLAVGKDKSGWLSMLTSELTSFFTLLLTSLTILTTYEKKYSESF